MRNGNASQPRRFTTRQFGTVQNSGRTTCGRRRFTPLRKPNRLPTDALTFTGPEPVAEPTRPKRSQPDRSVPIGLAMRGRVCGVASRCRHRGRRRAGGGTQEGSADRPRRIGHRQESEKPRDCSIIDAPPAASPSEPRACGRLSDRAGAGGCPTRTVGRGSRGSRGSRADRRRRKPSCPPEPIRRTLAGLRRRGSPRLRPRFAPRRP